MAKLGKPVTIPDFSHLDWKDQWEAEDAWFEEYRKSNDVIGFGVADGGAFYKVSPGRGTLYHIPFGDAYAIPYAHVRGLRKDDIERMLAPSPFGRL